MKDLIDENSKKMIEEEALNIDPNIFNNFDEKRENGENESRICELIHNDSIENFIVYINKNNIPIRKAIIKPSVFETNSLLIKKRPTLIEYAAFYGSIQIFKYLQLNNVELNPSLWLYAIHGNNAELIYLLEENDVKPPKKSYKICLEEAIKCHHNDIANYIINNLIEDDDQIYNIEHDFYNNLISYSLKYQNYLFYPKDLEDKYAFLYFCQFDYLNLVNFYLKHKEIDVNFKIVYIYF